MEQIRQFEKLEGSALNDIKVVLADEATKLLHGEDCLKSIHATVQSLFQRTGGDDLDSLPKYTINKSLFNESNNIAVVDLLLKSEMVSSRNEGRRLIKAGGVKVNDVKVTDEFAAISISDFEATQRVKLSSGKKKHVLFLFE
jgi:tyrosyl-tRNA synthetase